MRLKWNKQRILSLATALLLGISIIVTGTLAWQSISQKATNEAQGSVNPGARLHDDFDGRNKDVYVENFGDLKTNGVPIFARVQLREYMEIGSNAGALEGDKQVTILGNPRANIKDPSTWLVHHYGIIEENTGSNHKAMHKYWTWHYGGKTTFMPTFNKNKDSLAPDINGTFAGADGNRDEGVRYDDYVQWNLGETKTADEVYDADNNNLDEGDLSEEGTNHRTEPLQEHSAMETLEAEVVSMEEWINLERPIGNYWVYDTDGWAYYAKPILPGEASGLLLDGITSPQQPNEEWYYAIHAIGQFATAGDWGDKQRRTGFYKDGITENAIALLDKVAEQLPKIEKVEIQGGKRQSAKAGETKNLRAIVDVKNPTGNKAETYVTWTIDPKTTALVGDKFTPTTDMVGKRFTLTATSAFDPSKSDKAEFIIYPESTAGTVTGDLDGKLYINLGDNTFREVMVTPAGQELGELICAGADQLIGNGDDNTNVVELEKPDPIYGSKYLGPNEGDTYWSVGPDKKLGTSDDIKVIGDPWPTNISNVLADSIIISTTGNGKTVKIGEQEKLSAQVSLQGKPIGKQDVTWAVSGQEQPGTSIDQDGYLRIAETERVGRMLTVKATSKEMPSVVGYAYYRVAPRGWEDLHLIPEGSNKLVFIDGKYWHVIAKEGNKALISSWDSIGNMQFSDNNEHEWPTSTLRTYLNSTFLDNHPTLKEKVVETEITTRTKATASQPSYNGQWHTTKDKVFLPNGGDLWGWQQGATNDARDFTVGNVTMNGFLWPTSGQNTVRFYESASSTPHPITGRVHGWGRAPHDPSGNIQCAWWSQWTRQPNYWYRTSWSSKGDAKPTARNAVRPLLWVKMPGYVDAAAGESGSSSSSEGQP